MKTKEEILDNNCDKDEYLDRRQVLIAMQEYADQQTKELREEIERLKGRTVELIAINKLLNNRISHLEYFNPNESLI